LKKYTKIAYIVLILLIILFGFFIYKVFAKNTSEGDVKSKLLSEVKYLENKFSSLFNQTNNINFEKYKISTSKVEEKESEKQNSSSGGQGANTDNSKKSETSGSSGKSEGTNSSEESDSSKEDNKKYQLEETGILTGNTDINWDYMKNEVENMYTSLYTTTLDLYQTSTNQEDIVNFNKEYDKLTQAVKNENKEETLKELSNLYNYLPKFVDNCTNEEKEKIITNTKNNIFKAYSILDKEDWNQIAQYINNAIQEFTRLVTTVDNKENINQYNVNKAYIMINELQNAVILGEKDVFLIKYKNLLEELQNIWYNSN